MINVNEEKEMKKPKPKVIGIMPTAVPTIVLIEVTTDASKVWIGADSGFF